MAAVVVIGAGVGGLAVAGRLCAQGHRVTLCEQSGQVGGKLVGYERDGFVFDTGPSLLTLPAVYRDLFRKTGEPLEEVLQIVPVDPAFSYRFADGTTLELPNASRSGVARAMDDAFGPGNGEQWNRLMARAGRIWEITRRPFLEQALAGPMELIRSSRNPADWLAVAPWRTLRGLGRRYLRDPRARMVLDRYATYTGSDPRRAPAALATVPYVEQTFGAWHVPGGLHRLAAALHERALATGAAVRTSTEVAQVLTDGGRASGVRLTSGEHLQADVVVSDADAAHLYRDLVRHPGADKPLRALRGVAPSLSGFVLLLGVRGRTPGLRHHTVLFPTAYDPEFDAIFGAAPRPVEDPTVYVCAPDDPLMRPDDESEAWSVLVNAPRHGAVDWTDTALVDRYADRVLDVMAQRGLDVRPRLLWREVRTPADLERRTRSPGGAIYGSSSNGARAAFLRPANRSPVPGLFLVGGSAHPGGGLPLVGMSAAIVAGMVGRA